jgi:hypothetical protein
MAMDRATGAVRWQVHMPDAVLGAVAAVGDKLICPVRNGQVMALSASDGKVIWQSNVSGNCPVLAGVAATPQWVYAVSRDGCLAVMGMADGRVIERHSLNDEAEPGKMQLTLSSPTIAGGRLFVGSETGGLRCYVGKTATSAPATQPAGSAGQSQRWETSQFQQRTPASRAASPALHRTGPDAVQSSIGNRQSSMGEREGSGLRLDPSKD